MSADEIRYPVGRVYKITNDVNDLVYIGSTRLELRKRFNGHIRALKVGRESTKWMAALHEIGQEHFSIELLEEMPNVTTKELELREFEYIASYDPALLYNTQLEYRKATAESRAKMSVGKLGSLNPYFRRGCVNQRNNSNCFMFIYYVDGDPPKKKRSKSFGYGPRCKMDQEEAHSKAQAFRDTIFPVEGAITSEEIAARYSSDNGKFVDNVWVANK